MSFLPRRLKELWLRLHWLSGRSRFSAELSDEMDFHIESRSDELEQSGLPRAEAVRIARREFGPRLRTAEDTASAWQIQWLEDLFSDVRYAARAFRRNPAFAGAAIFCLALGIGANTTVFNITTSFLFSEPSCRDSASIVSISVGGNSNSPMADYKFVDEAHLLSGMAGANFEREVNWQDGDRNKRLYAGVVTGDFFTTLDIPLRLGRGIAQGEVDTAVLSERIWRSLFGADPAILGRKIILEGRVYTVAGVLPENHRSIFGFGISPEVYVPVTHDNEYVQFYGRLPKGMNIGVARERLRATLSQLDVIRPVENWKRTGNLIVTGVTGFDMLNQQMPGAVTAFFVMLLVVVGLVLLIACTNVASLLLARASSRSNELTIRLSLGASRQRIIRHLLAESLLLSVLGALAGIAINLACARLLKDLVLPVPVPIRLVILPDWRLMLYSLGMVLVSALLCGLLPALKAVRKDVNAGLKQEGRHTGRTWNLRSLLVAGQLAVSIVLLAAGFLFLHNLLRATAMDPGFNVRRTLWASMRLVPDRYSDPGQARQRALVNTAMERIRALPGVESASIAHHIPLNENCVDSIGVRTDLSAAPMRVRYQCNAVGPDFFRTLSIPVLRGREFSSVDRIGSQPVVIVNQAFAHQVFGGADPVGHAITLDYPGAKAQTIVGVVTDSKYVTLSENQLLAVYEPYFAKDEPVHLNFVVRTAASPGAYVKTVSDELSRLDSSAAVEVKPMSEALGLALLPSQAAAVMLGTMGALALILASIGLYGVLLYSVSRRTREIGLRMALGASQSDVLRIVLRHSLVLVGSGVAVGLILAFFAMQPLAFFLVPGVSASDSTAFLAVIAVLAGVALLATLAPALRALRVDPMVALRYE